MSEEYKDCPNCGQQIKYGAIKCRHCLSFIGPEDESYEQSYSKAEQKEEPFPKETIPPEPDQLYQEPLNNLGSGEKSFFSALFDVNMTEMVTPRIIRVFFVLGLLAIGLGMVAAIISSIITIGSAGIGMVLIALITAPLGAFIAIILLRVYLELIVLLFNIYDQLKDIKASLK